MNSNIKEKLTDVQIHHTMHIKWHKLEREIKRILSKILEREIKIQTIRSDFYDWGIDTMTTPLSQQDISKINKTINRNDTDVLPDKEYRTFKLDMKTSNAIVETILPFKLYKAFADDDGVWFVGKKINNEQFSK